MKWTAYGVILTGMWLIANAADCQQRGVAKVMVPLSRSSLPETASRDKNPKAFQNLMRYQWMEAGTVLLLGIMVLLKVRREDSLDPFSENFAGAASIDELERTLDDRVRKQKTRGEG